jgi:hypothetical protein
MQAKPWCGPMTSNVFKVSLIKCCFYTQNGSMNKKNITTVSSVTNTWSIQQTPMFHGCTITNNQNVEPWKRSICPFPYLWHSTMTLTYVSRHISYMRYLMKENPVLNFKINTIAYVGNFMHFINITLIYHITKQRICDIISMDFPSWDTSYMKYDVTHMLTSL